MPLLVRGAVGRHLLSLIIGLLPIADRLHFRRLLTVEVRLAGLCTLRIFPYALLGRKLRPFNRPSSRLRDFARLLGCADHEAGDGYSILAARYAGVRPCSQASICSPPQSARR